MTAHLVSDSSAPARTLIESSRAALGKLLPHGCLDRKDAVELLAVDALVTYAFEAAAEDPESLQQLAQEAMKTFSSLAS